METRPSSSDEEGDQPNQSNTTTPQLDQKTPFRNLGHGVHRRLTIVFPREENVEISYAGKPVVQHREHEDQPNTTVDSTTRPDSVEEYDHRIQPSTLQGTEGATPSQEGDRSTLDEEAPQNKRDIFRHILDEEVMPHVHLVVEDILKRLRNSENPVNDLFRNPKRLYLLIHWQL